jgi:DHA2 family multidrug resistance protein-like MFS transporter
VVASVCCFAGQAVSLVALPFYLQHTLGLSTLATGLYITPWPLTVMLAAQVAGRLANTVSTAWLCASGGACLSAGLAAAAVVPLHDHPLAMIPIAMLCGLGFGLFQVPNNRSLFLSAPQARSGAAGGLQSAARLIGQTAGVVLMTLLFGTLSLDLAPRIGLAIGAVLTLMAGLLSLLHHPEQGLVDYVSREGVV